MAKTKTNNSLAKCASGSDSELPDPCVLFEWPRIGHFEAPDHCVGHQLVALSESLVDQPPGIAYRVKPLPRLVRV